MALIGYARVSTEEQLTKAQEEELVAAGCDETHLEHASGASRARPVLARALNRIRPRDVLLVVRIDRLARSLSHLPRWPGVSTSPRQNDKTPKRHYVSTAACHYGKTAK